MYSHFTFTIYRCSVVNHNPVCTCFDGYQGDPFYSCEKTLGMSFSFLNKFTFMQYLITALMWWLLTFIFLALCIAYNKLEVYNENVTPCHPNPCGYNADCTERNGVGSCICKDNFFGDPYESCRPECVLNADCPSHLACVNSKCKDTCAGSCGVYSECRVVNHVANCICITGYTGNPYSNCYLIQEERKNTFSHSFASCELTILLDQDSDSLKNCVHLKSK